MKFLKLVHVYKALLQGLFSHPDFLDKLSWKKNNTHRRSKDRSPWHFPPDATLTNVALAVWCLNAALVSEDFNNKRVVERLNNTGWKSKSTFVKKSSFSPSRLLFEYSKFNHPKFGNFYFNLFQLFLTSRECIVYRCFLTQESGRIQRYPKLLCVVEGLNIS